MKFSTRTYGLKRTRKNGFEEFDFTPTGEEKRDWVVIIGILIIILGITLGILGIIPTPII